MDRYNEESEITYHRIQAKLLQIKNMKFKVGIDEHKQNDNQNNQNNGVFKNEVDHDVASLFLIMVHEGPKIND